MATVPKVILGSLGKSIPVIGLGVCAFPPVGPEITRSAVVEAIKVGYRHFDTAYVYGTEHALGEAIKEAISLGLIKSRDEVYITTKLACTFAERHKVVAGIRESLKNLQLDYIDMYLIHHPFRITSFVTKPNTEAKDLYKSSTKEAISPIAGENIFPLDIKSVWEGMEECLDLGLAKAIGVSNFSCRMLGELLATAKIPPMANQVEMNPYWKQKSLRDYCKAKGIHITAYSPLGANGTMWGDNRIMNCEVLSDIAKAKGKTIAQVSLRWVYEQGASMVPKSFNKERMKQNLGIFDWSLTEEESNRISKLPERKGVKFASTFGPHDIMLALDAEL